jgi:hypothetical protein|tara:strand:- start:5244 stop:5426 length:183 start_codon:yes stop_codon:yes gene_type:complete
MDTIAWSDFKRMTAKTVTEGACLRLTSDGATIAYVVIRPEQAMQARVEGVCSQIDASRGR